MSAIYCISYNNYFNRTVKREETLAAYLGANNANVRYSEANFNFNPNDGANAAITVGRSENPANSYGDYLLVVESGAIVSRWFILDEERLRGKQYRLNLRRDIVADYYEQVLNSTAFIEKGLPKYDSTLIFNSEGIPFNQIKKGEIPLVDESKMAWICGFVDRSMESKTVEIDTDVVSDISVADITQWVYYQYVNNTLETAYDDNFTSIYPSIWFYQYINSTNTEKYYVEFNINKVNGNYYTQRYDPSFDTAGIYYIPNSQESATKSQLSDNNLKMWNEYAKNGAVLFGGLFDAGKKQTQKDILTLRDKIIKDEATGRTYKISVINKSSTAHVTLKAANQDCLLWTYANNILQPRKISGNNTIVDFKVTTVETRITLTEVSFAKMTITIPDKTGRYTNKNAPFDTFCIPFSDDMKIVANGTTFQANKGLAMNIGSEIARTLGTACYDVQLLPFCPMTGFIIEDNGTTFNINSTAEKRTTFVKNSESANVYALFWSTASSGTRNIFKSDGTPYVTVSDKKIENECDFYRLVSPNYNGQFEFSAAKNGGVQFFNVDYTYLPYSSYIHVNPDFAQLYGQDFNDARGLICQGDFSITYLSDAWVNYQIQNKNYNNIFDREISNMDTVHGIENTQKRVAGAINAAVTGATVAAAGSGIIGSAKSAVLGGVAAIASYGGAEADILFGNKIYEENKSYKKDIFEYSLDNVRALPNSIAKTTAYTENNKIFPVLEYYSCTDEEKNILANEIAQRGMTIGSIDYILNYVSNKWEYNGIVARNFIKAQLIKTDIKDNHIADVLSTELAKGLYFEV